MQQNIVFTVILRAGQSMAKKLLNRLQGYDIKVRSSFSPEFSPKNESERVHRDENVYQ